MRILHVCDSIIGGTGSYLAELLPLQAIRHGGHNIALLLPEQQRDYLEQRILDSDIQLIYFSRRNRVAGMASLTRRYVQARRRHSPDIVHAHSFGAGVVTRTSMGRQPLVFCPHGWATDMQMPQVATAALMCVERTLARRADRILLISRHEETRAKEMGIHPTKLITVLNGISLDKPVVQPAAWDDERFKLLFVGRMDRQKGLDTLLEAIKSLSDRVCLRVVGSSVLSKPTASQAGDGAVTYCGWRDREGVAAEMMACDALIVPSRWEGFGLVAVEAMRLGVPVIASDVGGLGETLDHGRYGIVVPPDDPLSLRRALETLTPERLKTLGKIGRERFLAKFTADRMVAEIDAVYADVLSETARKTGAAH